jgi:hypothetical protein
MKNETFENQVIRVLNEMVANGEIEATVRNGETHYRKVSQTTQLNQPKIKSSKFEKRSIAAKKAWNTRKTKVLAQRVISYDLAKPMMSRIVADLGKDEAWLFRSAAAKKAWATRRSKAAKSTVTTTATATATATTTSTYSERAKKAWITRRLKCKNNPVKRTERLQIAKKLVKPELEHKFKLRRSEKTHSYVSFDQHLERAWQAYEASVKKSLLVNETGK